MGRRRTALLAAMVAAIGIAPPAAAAQAPTPAIELLSVLPVAAEDTSAYSRDMVPLAAGQWWRPAVGTTWQWQLSGAVDTSVSAEVFNIDGESASAATVATLHANGARVICYFAAGGWESYRSDAGSFPAGVLGNAMDGWPDERWLDIRQLTVLLPIMEARIADCDQKGFDAVEPDLLDGYTNDTGFALTAADQLAYNRALADLAHRYGLGVALKNDPEQAEALEPAFDFAAVEECYQYDECEAYTPFVRAGKAVLHVEYEGSLDAFCPATTALGFSSMKKHLSLDAWREVCPPGGTTAIEGWNMAAPVRVSLDVAVSPGVERCVQVGGIGGVPVDAAGVFLNVTTVRPNGPGYVVVYPAAASTAATLAPQASTVNFEPGADVANSAFVDLSADGRVCYVTAGAASVGVILDVTGFTMAESGMVAQRAQRLLDTRAGVDHVGEITGPVAARTVQTIQVSGLAGVPVGATAAIVNVTVTGATTVGNLRVFAAGTAVPNTSVVNFAAGQDKASSAFVDLSADGRISFWSDSPVSAGASPVQVIIDVVGYVLAETAYTSVTPTRVVDTRAGSGHVGPIPGALAARRVYSVPLTDVGSIPADAVAVVVNVTAIQPSGFGNLRVFADVGGAGLVTPPATSTINYIPGRDIPNQVLVPAGGVLDFWSDMAAGGTVHLAVDVVGFVSAD